jgi:hypothetical protein
MPLCSSGLGLFSFFLFAWWSPLLFLDFFSMEITFKNQKQVERLATLYYPTQIYAKRYKFWTCYRDIIEVTTFSPPPPHAHVRLSLAPEPPSTEFGSGERDACPSIYVCLCLGVLSYVVVSRGTNTYIFLFIVRMHSPSPAPVRLICTIAIVTPPGIFYPSLDLRPGTTARTVHVLGILDVVDRYQYRDNIHQRVVNPLQGSRYRRASSLSVYVYCKSVLFLSPTSV